MPSSPRLRGLFHDVAAVRVDGLVVPADAGVVLRIGGMTRGDSWGAEVVNYYLPVKPRLSLYRAEHLDCRHDEAT